MSFLQENTPKTISQTGLYISELVAQKLSNTEDLLYLSPLTTPDLADTPLSYYGKQISVTTQETKGLRKLSRLFNKLAEQGYIPSITTSNLAIEWGSPDSMRLAFFPLLNSYVHVKEFSLAKTDAEEDNSSQKRVFITGTCMYGKNGVIGKTDKGKTLSLVDPYITPVATYEEFGCITSLEFEDEFHTYEIVEALSRGNILNGIKADKILFNVPVIPYVLYAKEAISRGIMDANLMDLWVGQLKKRASQLVAYEQSICNGKVIPVDPLYPYLDFICNPQTTVEDISKFLSKTDVWWKAYLEENPANKFADFGNASYARVYYDQLGASSSPQVVVAVEDQTEMQILLKVKKLIDSGVFPKLNENSSMIGIYPFTPIIFPDNTGMANATFFTDGIGKRASADDVFDLCAMFADKTLLSKARAAYASIQSAPQSNDVQFNIF